MSRNEEEGNVSIHIKLKNKIETYQNLFIAQKTIKKEKISNSNFNSKIQIMFNDQLSQIHYLITVNDD